MESGFQLAQRQAAAYEAQTGRFMSPSAQLIAESAGLGSGDAVLDLACGTGFIARHAFAMVQPGGRVVGADVNPAMIAVAKSVTEPGIDWIEAPAHDLPFDDATFTHLLCQQGFQFFPDGAAAAREAHRVLRPGGALVATIWATPGQNPYIETQLALLSGLDGAIAGSVSAATPVGADDLLRRLASAGGFNNIEVSVLEHSILVENLGAFFVNQTATTPWGPVIAGLTPVDTKQLADDFVARLAKHAVVDGHRLRFCSHMLRGHK